MLGWPMSKTTLKTTSTIEKCMETNLSETTHAASSFHIIFVNFSFILEHFKIQILEKILTRPKELQES